MARAMRATSGLDGGLMQIRSPFDAVRHGLALVPDDRKGKAWSRMLRWRSNSD